MNKAIKVGDKLAVSLSLLCALHCFAFPIVVATLPSLQFLESEKTHLLMMIIIIPTSLVSLLLGCNKHKRKNLLLIALIGLSILFTASIWGHDLFGCKNEKYVTLLGSCIVSYAHISNYLKCLKANNLSSCST